MENRIVCIFLFICFLHYGNSAQEGQACSPGQSYNGQDLCDTDQSKLECYFGRCTCPTRKFYRNVPLNTYWYAPWGKCVSLPLSSCDIQVYGSTLRSGYQCQPGTHCINQYGSTDPTVGICGGSFTKPFSIFIFLGIIYILIGFK